MAISLGDNIKLALGLPNDARYYSTTTNKPWTGCTDVTTNLAGGAGGVRYTGLTVNINGTEYWFRDGIEDGDLIEKTTGGGTGQLNWSGSTTNAIGTYISPSGICAQENLTFNGSVLNVGGDLEVCNDGITTITIRDTTGTNRGDIDFNNASATCGVIRYDFSDNTFKFFNSGNERLSITSGGTTCAATCLESPIVCGTSCVQGAVLCSTGVINSDGDVKINSDILHIEGAAPRVRFSENGETNSWTIIQDGNTLDFREDYTLNPRFRLFDGGAACACICMSSPVICGTSCIDTNTLNVQSGAIFNTNTDTTPVQISRLGTISSEVMNIGVNDTDVTFDYIEDTTSEGTGNFGKYIFRLSGNDSEPSCNPLIICKDCVVTAGKTLTSTLQVTTGAASGCVLTSDASGNATWESPSGGGVAVSGTTDNALTTYINSTGNICAEPNLTYDGTDLELTAGTARSITITCGTTITAKHCWSTGQYDIVTFCNMKLQAQGTMYLCAGTQDTWVCVDANLDVNDRFVVNKTNYDTNICIPAQIEANSCCEALRIFGDSGQTGNNVAFRVYNKGGTTTGGNYAIWADAYYSDGPSANGRSHGIWGLAGNKTSCYNYAVIGQLCGTNDGAAIVGTDGGFSTTLRAGCWAGYFDGCVFNCGTLCTTGDICFCQGAARTIAVGEATDGGAGDALNICAGKGDGYGGAITDGSNGGILTFRGGYGGAGCYGNGGIGGTGGDVRIIGGCGAYGYYTGSGGDVCLQGGEPWSVFTVECGGDGGNVCINAGAGGSGFGGNGADGHICLGTNMCICENIDPTIDLAGSRLRLNASDLTSNRDAIFWTNNTTCYWGNYLTTGGDLCFNRVTGTGAFIVTGGLLCATSINEGGSLLVNKYVRQDTCSDNNAFAGDYLVFNYAGTNNDYMSYNDTANAFYFNADTTFTNTSANAQVNVGCLVVQGSTGYKICMTSACGCAVDWVATSDCRFKDNITPIACALSKVDALCGVCYDFCEDGTPDIGLIAQEVEKVEPRLVALGEPSPEQKEKYGIEDQTYGLKYDKFAGLFVEAIKELKEQNICLQNQINALREKLNK